MLSGKILITGGTGSLGTALTSFLINSKDVSPKDITLLARNETKLNQSRIKFPDVRCEAGDVRDLDWLRTIFPGHRYIIHAGALKVVPTAEVNCRETMTTNVIGSQNVAMAAVESGISRVIGISSDKACQPQTLYGASKFMMESLLRESNSWGNTSFNTVRYGNVLGSNQSVVPFFKNLIEKDKPITVTQFQMSRFWLSMVDALDLIWNSLFWEETGVILVPKAKASDMLTLAKAVIPHNNYPIIEIGKRPGEKIHEKMIHSGETYHTRDAGKYFVIYHPANSVSDPLPEDFEYRSDTCEHYSVEELRQKIAESV